MINFKSGLINLISTIISIPMLVLLIIFSSIYGNGLLIVFYTLLASFTSLYFIFSTLYNWIKNDTCKNIFIRFMNIFKILLIFTVILMLAFIDIPSKLLILFLIFIAIIELPLIIFHSIWKSVPNILLSILSFIAYILVSVFLFLLILS